jgi:hypothetical protein
MEKHELECHKLHSEKHQILLTQRQNSDQETLFISTISAAKKKILNASLASVCYEKAFMKKALRQLNSAYTPSSRKAISEKLLNSAYENFKLKVDLHLATLSNLNIIADESLNINNARIVNIFIHTFDDSFH